MSGLGLRIISGVLLLGLAIAALWFGGLLLMGLLAAATVLGAHEFYSMARRAGYRPLYPAGVALSLLLAMRAYLAGDIAAGAASSRPGSGAEVMVLALVLVLLLAEQGLFQQKVLQLEGAGSVIAGRPRPSGVGWADIGITLAGAVYTGGLLGYAAMLAALPASGSKASGTAWLLLVVFGTAACDIGAYAVGSLAGRHKLIPHVSPAKTWEGLAGGVLGAVICAVAMSGFLGIGLLQAVVLGIIVCAAAVAGDLCESLLKRATGVKDSSNLIPGHGGLLDRLDSILFALLAVYWFVRVSV
ncbi:MAG TPA: phosphatidate cytidylyltransferase [Chloroflexia bacterium]|nr:phosphatidate cytidylyltransferase [Chloroflexia bacterium]